MNWKVNRIGHVSVKAADPERGAQFFTELLGFQVTDRDDSGRVYLSASTDHHNLVLVPSDEVGLADIGFVLGSDEQLSAAYEALSAGGLTVRDEASGKSGQGRTLSLCDPAGVTVELYADLEQVSAPTSPHPARPANFGHVTMEVPDIEASNAFYTRVLGFRESEWIEDFFVWLRCNSDHHVVALMQAERLRLHHYGFDLTDFSDFKRVCDFLASNDHPITYGPGRHGPGDNLFIYFEDGLGNFIEYQAELLQIQDDEHYRPKVWKAGPNAMNQWGPAAPAGFQ